MTLGAMSIVPFALASPAGAATPGQVVITEWMYNPTQSPPKASEFVEVTNVGGAPVDMTTYSFDDDSRTPGSFSLAALGSLAPGESGLIIETTAAAFRADWGLGASVKIAELNTNNLGRNDEINIFNGTTLADRLTYGDQNISGTIRTQGTSGVPTSCQALGANTVGAWVFSQSGVDGAKKSLSGDTGSPGASPLGTCGPVTIVGGDGSGSTVPCRPEPASGTGPAPADAQTWPGGATVTVADQLCAWKTTTGPEGRDMSGLVFDPANPDVLWAVKNKSWVFRLVQQGDVWVPDTANDWGAGKQIFFPGGVGQPDSEGLTVGPDGALYITTERDNSNNTFALNSILRFDPTAAGTTLTPTEQWNLTADFPELIVPGGDKDKANLGFEGVTFVPDTYLVQNGFVDQSTGSAYYPSDYPGHGSGLFFAALENDGKLYAYALNADGTAHRVAVVDTGMGHVMDVQYDRDLERIWALCDNTCSVTSTLLDMDATGAIVPEVRYAATRRPDRRPAEREHRGVRDRARLDVRQQRQGGRVVRRRNLRRRPPRACALPRHVPVRRRPRWPRRAGGRRPRRPWPWRRQRRQEGHAPRARFGLLARRNRPDRAARQEEGGRARLDRRRRLRSGRHRRQHPGRRPARRPADLAGRPVGHGDCRPHDHHTRRASVT